MIPCKSPRATIIPCQTSGLMVLMELNFNLAGHTGYTGHTDSRGVACELSGYLCDLAERSDLRPHQIHLTEAEPFPVEHSFNGSSNQT